MIISGATLPRLTIGVLRSTFVSHDCPYFKIDVEFEPVARPDFGYGALGFSPENNPDVIVKVSKPYVQFAPTNEAFGRLTPE